MTPDEIRLRYLGDRSLKDWLAAQEKRMIDDVLHAVADNRAEAAGVLGISREALFVKLRRHGFDKKIRTKRNSNGGPP